MMKLLKRLVFYLLILLFTGVADLYAQDGGNSNGGSGTEAQPTGKAARRKAKKDWWEKRKKDMADAKARKEYRKMNTKKTQKRMKRSEKKARRNNEHRREFFLTRWIKKHRNHRK